MADQPPHDQTPCDGVTLTRLAAAGRDWLDQHHAEVNQLNVFPVPDGDTGINMLMTMRNAVQEAEALDSDHIGQVALQIANGAMMGSRGNSGTILSQLWQGFAHVLRDQQVLTPDLLVQGLREAADAAYRGVIKPVEGTILTVAREAAEEGEVAINDTDDIIAILERVVARAKDALARTPEMLPILQKAGVVDSGGSGLVYIMEGMLLLLQGQEIHVEHIAVAEVKDLEMALAPEDEMGYGYDVQFILKGEALDVGVVRAVIDSMGWSTVVVGNPAAIKVHVHVHDPGIPISYAVSLGAISDIVVENMQEQYHDYVRERTAGDGPAARIAEPEFTPPELDEDDIGVVTVASGEGIARVFRQLGAAELVMGGQTNNPSTQEILEAIQRVPTRKIVLLPNNKNIILAAEQAARLATNQEVVVIPTRSMPQGISALLPYDAKGDFDDITEAMHEAKDDIITGEVTTATRSVELNGVQVSEGQIIGLVDGALVVAGDEVGEVLKNLLAEMCSGDCELITMYYGNNVPEADARQIMDEVSTRYPDQEFELVLGGQAHYHFIVSAE